MRLRPAVTEHHRVHLARCARRPHAVQDGSSTAWRGSSRQAHAPVKRFCRRTTPERLPGRIVSYPDAEYGLLSTPPREKSHASCFRLLVLRTQASEWSEAS